MKTKAHATMYLSETGGGTVRVGAIVPDDTSKLSSEFYLEIECLPDRTVDAKRMLKRILTTAGYVVKGTR